MSTRREAGTGGSSRQPGTRVRINLNPPHSIVQPGTEGVIEVCPTVAACRFLHVLPDGRVLPIVVRPDEVEAVSLGGASINRAKR